MDRIGTRVSRRSCAAEEVIFGGSKFKGAVTTEVAEEESERSSIAVDCERLKTVS